MTSAHDYNPFGTEPEHPKQVANVLDGDPNTVWSTEHYLEDTLGSKPGTGFYIDAAPGLRARALEVQTPTPGFSAAVYGANTSRRLPFGSAQSLVRTRLDAARAGAGDRRAEHDPPGHGWGRVSLLPVLDHAPAARQRNRGGLGDHALLHRALGLQFPVMRRRIRSVALVPFHRHVLPQIAVDGALVALAYYLAFHLRFDQGLTHRYVLLLERTIWWVAVGGVLVLVLSRVYLRSWSYAGQRDYGRS